MNELDGGHDYSENGKFKKTDVIYVTVQPIDLSWAAKCLKYWKKSSSQPYLAVFISRVISALPHGNLMFVYR